MHSSGKLSSIERLVEEFLDRQQRGEDPTVDEYCQRHPGLAEQIREVFEALLMVQDLKPGSQDESGTCGSGIRVDGKHFDQIGDYRILCEIGRGGMGVVYEAEQLSLGRRVALKVLPRQLAGEGKSLARFQREARAAARMHHTNIVPVFEVGNDAEHVFYAMQLIHGQSLELVIDDLTRLRQDSLAEGPISAPSPRVKSPSQPALSIAKSLFTGRFQQATLGREVDAGESRSALPPEDTFDSLTETIALQSGSTTSAMLPGKSDISTAESDRHAYFISVAQIGLQTASALAYAHARGIVHRDIKPSNLLLDAAGVVWVTDFGLAKTGDDGLTHTGDILGTIRYMSPERFRGQCDVRADVYSLGLTLYELLTLKPAFVAADQMSLIDRINKLEPAPPRAADARVPRDLETIVLKAIDKDAKRRYQSADDLAEDLQRFIDDEPIKARPVSNIERFVRWSRRNQSVAAALAVVAALLVLMSIGSVVAASYFYQQRDAQSRLAVAKENEAKKAVAAQEQAEFAAERNRRLLYTFHMQLARRSHNCHFWISGPVKPAVICRAPEQPSRKTKGSLQPGVRSHRS